MRERFMKIMLVIIALLLFLNLAHQNIFSAFAQYDQPSSIQDVSFRGNGVSVACSEDGKFVYAAANAAVYRSENYGKANSWEKVLD